MPSSFASAMNTKSTKWLTNTVGSASRSPITGNPAIVRPCSFLSGESKPTSSMSPCRLTWCTPAANVSPVPNNKARRRCAVGILECSKPARRKARSVAASSRNSPRSISTMLIGIAMTGNVFARAMRANNNSMLGSAAPKDKENRSRKLK